MSSLARDKSGQHRDVLHRLPAPRCIPNDRLHRPRPWRSAGHDGRREVLNYGTGSQTDTSNRWGDYYNMALSNDGCTFVTTGEYYTTTASFHWSTRIAKLKFENCTPSN